MQSIQYNRDNLLGGEAGLYSIKADRPTDWPYCNVHVLADLHIGDPLCNMSDVNNRIARVKEDPYGVCILNGDLMNTATKASVSDIYSERLSISEQVDVMTRLLRPIKDKIIGCTIGNHENRIYKQDGIDTMRFIMRDLGIEENYNPEGVLIFLRFGEKRGHEQHGPRSRREQHYVIYACHGSGGGGRKVGGKANRLDELADIVDADVYVRSHTHQNLAFTEDYYRADVNKGKAVKVTRLFISTAAALDYGGYSQVAEFRPASMANPVIHLEGKMKRASAIL